MHDSLPININTETGIIGSSILDNYIVTIDYLRMKLYLEKIKTKKRRIDKSGLVIQSIAPDYKTYKVSFVVPNAPAAKAGILKGDEIIKYKWHPIIFTSLDKLRNKLAGSESKQIRLKMKRNGKSFKVKFRLNSDFKKNSPTNF